MVGTHYVGGWREISDMCHEKIEMELNIIEAICILTSVVKLLTNHSIECVASCSQTILLEINTFV